MSKNAQLEKLIAQYEDAIHGGSEPDEIERLGDEVEAEADRVGYDNHRRLHALHSMAELSIEEWEFDNGQFGVGA